MRFTSSRPPPPGENASSCCSPNKWGDNANNQETMCYIPSGKTTDILRIKQSFLYYQLKC